jgi:pSer/pThr/pTyr-binding forkhead associated (FHA) protein
MPSLRITLPDNKGEITHVLSGQRITIGRRPDNTIQIIHGSISGYHAELISAAGHYRLHDLGSTNLTCVDGQPVIDYHLHADCMISFGSIQCDYRLEHSKDGDQKAAELVPTRAELEFLRRENLDLLSKISSLKKQVDILSNARLTTKSTTLLLTPDANRRAMEQRDELRLENASLKQETEILRADLMTMIRDRDALLQAWETMRMELEALKSAQAAPTRESEMMNAGPALSPSPAFAPPSKPPKPPKLLLTATPEDSASIG